MNASNRVLEGEILFPDKASSEARAEAYVRTPHNRERTQRGQGTEDPLKNPV